MPTYEYKCSQCGHNFELFQGIKDPPCQKCPECRGAVRRLIGGGSGIIFKGSGFYATDYRSKQYKQAEKNDQAKTSPGKDIKGKGKVGGKKEISG